MTVQNGTTPVLLLEFNELTPSLIDRFVCEGRLPNFKILHDESEVYTTHAVEKYPYLEPWIQWITVHCGLNYDSHGVFRLGDGRDLTKPCIWDLLSEHRFRVWLCGSMNIRYDSPINGYVLPDPWSANVRPFPDSLTPYYRFVQAHVQEYTNDRVPLGGMDYLKFLGFMMRHGLSPSTVAAIARQLVSERTGKYRWRRAAIMDRLQFDLFRAVYRRSRPHLSTFFLNSTAHLQHMYWRNMEPEAFRLKPTGEEQRQFAQAVLFGYEAMDRLVGDFRRLVGDAATIIFCTALSQQPCVMYEEQGGKVPHRPRSFDALLAFAGIRSPHRVSPVMSEQFRVYFETEQDAADAAKQLLALRVEERVALEVRQAREALFVSCQILWELPHDAMLTVADSDRHAPFFDIFYRIEGLKSGMHHPDGMLWVRHPDKRHCIHQDRVPLTAIAPMILNMFGVTPPAFMRDGHAVLDVAT
jgi:hypothetical protein